MIRFLTGIYLLMVLSGCSLHRLTVQTQYLSHENLASYYVGTPDAHLDHPTIGERLLIQWSLSKCAFEWRNLTLHLKIRFHNHKEDEIRVQIENQSGYYLYDLTNEKFCETGGILTYLAEIRDGDCVVESWKHPLWTPLISFDDHSQNK